MVLKATYRFAAACLVLVACSFVAPAQDAQQVLRVSVGYNTLKNSVTMSAEKRAEVERLEKLAYQANAARNYGDALKHLYHAMALMRGAEWTASRALASAVTAKLDRAVLAPSETFTLKLGQIYEPDEKLQGKLSAVVTLLKIKGEERVAELKTINDIEPDFRAHPFAAELKAPDVADGNYRLSVELRFTNADPVVKNIIVRLERGLASEFQKARARVAQLEKRLKPESPLRASLPSVEYRVSLFDLASESKISPDQVDFRAELKEADSMLAELEAGRDPLGQKRGDLKRAYRSKVDDTVQPYRIYVPKAYDRSKRYPLIIALHGMGRDEDSYFDDYAEGAFKLEAERRGYIVACPKGREPASMYRDAAERDVLDVLAEVRRAYNIDPDRIYMTGHSMGGFGTWSIAINNPEIFAALAPVAGGGNPKAMSKIAHIPQLVVHGDNDKTVSVEQSRAMVAAAKALGVEVSYIEVPRGSHTDIVVPTFDEVFDWFDTHRRKSAEAKTAPVAVKKD
ncbi:MAG TPA: prolyl oligopeptidase family serine peptidase [Blastocatellia bacterium]|nr:prolyl oligopeptidase family serine peptidase [Blastocatellia bacterium]